MDARKAFEAEVIAEATGKSRKKWALLLAAFLAGAMAAVWLVRRAQSVEPPITAYPEPSQERPTEPTASS
jgi:hypothetical protein